MTSPIETQWFVDRLKQLNSKFGESYEKALKLKRSNESLEDLVAREGDNLAPETKAAIKIAQEAYKKFPMSTAPEPIIRFIDDLRDAGNRAQRFYGLTDDEMRRMDIDLGVAFFDRSTINRTVVPKLWRLRKKRLISRRPRHLRLFSTLMVMGSKPQMSRQEPTLTPW